MVCILSFAYRIRYYGSSFNLHHFQLLHSGFGGGVIFSDVSCMVRNEFSISSELTWIQIEKNKECALELNFTTFLTSRYPFGWKTPLGYFVAWLSQWVGWNAIMITCTYWQLTAWPITFMRIVFLDRHIILLYNRGIKFTFHVHGWRHYEGFDCFRTHSQINRKSSSRSCDIDEALLCYCSDSFGCKTVKFLQYN